MFSFGIDPSITNTKGASSSPRAAARNGCRNSSPPRVGESTLLWRWTLGRPGIAPSSTSSIPGCPAAVIETESPSQLIPSEIQRMWTSSTPEAVACSTAMGRPFGRQYVLVVIKLERVDQQLLAGHELEIQPAALATLQREPRHRRLGAAGAATAPRRDLLDEQLGALERSSVREQLKGELQRRGHHLTEVADAHLDPTHRPRAGVPLDDR